jgi:hypothetical protein
MASCFKFLIDPLIASGCGSAFAGTQCLSPIAGVDLQVVDQHHGDFLFFFRAFRVYPARNHDVLRLGLADMGIQLVEFDQVFLSPLAG